MLNEADEACSVQLAGQEEFNENGSSGLLKDEIILSDYKFNYRSSSWRFAGQRSGGLSNRLNRPSESNRQTSRLDKQFIVRRYRRTDKRLLFKRKCKKKRPEMDEKTNLNQRRFAAEKLPNGSVAPAYLGQSKQTIGSAADKQPNDFHRQTVYHSDAKLDQNLIEDLDRRSLITKSGWIANELDLDKSIKKCSPTIEPSSLLANYEPLTDRPPTRLSNNSEQRAHRIAGKQAVKKQRFTARRLLFLVQLLIGQQFLLSRALALDICLENCNCIYSKNKFIADCSALALESLPVVSFSLILNFAFYYSHWPAIPH